jgi:hypothetical protein
MENLEAPGLTGGPVFPNRLVLTFGMFVLDNDVTNNDKCHRFWSRHPQIIVWAAQVGRVKNSKLHLEAPTLRLACVQLQNGTLRFALVS